jgi:radical SAM protein with 4Fe4S-binding SPASM domain
MKAKIQPRINTEGRTPLQDVIPLSTPFILFVDPSSICNFRCKFCPNGHPEIIKESGRTQCTMDFDLYKKIIDDLKEFDKPLKTLRLYKDGEPLLNPNLSFMIKYAKDSNHVQYIDTTTNGFFINNSWLEPIIEAGLDKINISVNGISNKDFLEFSGVKVDFNNYVENIKSLYKIKGNCEIVIKIPGDNLTPKGKEFFYETFGNYCDRIFIENSMNCWPEFDVEKEANIILSKEKGIYNQPISEVNCCPYIFYSMSVNSDGTVSVCFLDWQHKMIIGDVKHQSLKEIWDGFKLFKYQFMNLDEKRKDHSICRKCSQLSHGMADNIDPYLNELKERFLCKRL